MNQKIRTTASVAEIQRSHCLLGALISFFGDVVVLRFAYVGSVAVEVETVQGDYERFVGIYTLAMSMAAQHEVEVAI